MNEVWLWALAILGTAIAAAAWLAHLARKRHEHLRALGYELIYSLKGYSAWVDCQRDEPFRAGDADAPPLPEPLARACAVKDEAFPGLSQHMVRLLQAHSRLIEYLWQQNLLRLSQQTGWRPVWQDAQYQQIRGALEDLIQEMIGWVQDAIGDRAHEWRRTGTDFSFSTSTTSTTPGPSPGA